MVHFFFCFESAIFLDVAVLHISPSNGCNIFACSNGNMLYMFLGQKSLRIIMVLFICVFGKYKNESGDIYSHAPHAPSSIVSFPLNLIMPNFFAMLSHDKKVVPSTCVISCPSFHPLQSLKACSVSTLVDTFPSPESR